MGACVLLGCLNPHTYALTEKLMTKKKFFLNKKVRERDRLNNNCAHQHIFANFTYGEMKAFWGKHITHMHA